MLGSVHSEIKKRDAEIDRLLAALTEIASKDGYARPGQRSDWEIARAALTNSSSTEKK